MREFQATEAKAHLAQLLSEVWNASEFARAMGTSERTARNYLDIYG